MPGDSALYQELQKLRSRRGVDRTGLGRHLGPEIRRRSGLLGGEKDPRVRAAVETMLRSLAADLSPDLRQAAMLAFALERDYRFPTLDERAQSLADLQRISPRTARRRMDDALTAMVAAGEDAPEPPDGDRADKSGWRVSALRSLFRLDTATPELYEMRTIVANREIEEIVVRIGLPDPPDGVGEVRVEALFGARVRAVERSNGGSSHKVVLELPAKMAPGDRQESWLRVVLPPGQPTWSHYAIVPLDPCESGTVRVRFAPDRRPAEVWLLDEVPYTDLRERPPGRAVITPTALGDVFRDFHGLRQGYGYGIAWTPLPANGVSVRSGHVD